MLGGAHEGRGAEYLTDIRLTKPKIELCDACLAQASLDDDSVFKDYRCRDEPSWSIHAPLLADSIDLA